MDEAQESARPLTAMEIEEQRRAAAQAAPEEAPRMETFTYKDGSTRHGCAPFPKLSPIQEQAELNRKHAEAHGQHAAQGAPLEPVATTPPAGVVTAEQIAPSPAAAPEPTAKDLEAVAKAIEPTGEAVPEAAPAPAPKSTAKK